MESVHSAASIPNPARRYAAVEACIYCGRVATSQAKLTDEHIIPMAFGGNLVLPKASCFRCQRVINKFETVMFEAMLKTSRHHMRLSGRHKIKERDRLSVSIATNDSRTTISVNVDDHPGVFLQPQLFEPPGILSGRNPADTPVAVFRVAMTGMHEDIGRRFNRLGAGEVNITRPFGANDVFRMLGKIGLAFAVAELGVNGFQPELAPLILNDDVALAAHYIGGEQNGGASEGMLHSVGIIDHASIERRLPVMRRASTASLNSEVHPRLRVPSVIKPGIARPFFNRATCVVCRRDMSRRRLIGSRSS